MRKIVGRVIIVIILLSYCADFAHAEGPFTKLGRGLANTFTGWVEIFVTMQENCDKYDCVTGILSGLPVGTAKALIRTSVGVYETITFPFPFPKNYKPIIEPEFIIIKMRLEEVRSPLDKVRPPFENMPPE